MNESDKNSGDKIFEPEVAKGARAALGPGTVTINTTPAIPPPSTGPIDLTAAIQRPDKTASDAPEETTGTTALSTKTKAATSQRTVKRSVEEKKMITTPLPLHLAEQLKERQLEAQVNGTRFNTTDVLTKAVLGLPENAAAVKKLLDRYESQTNYRKQRVDSGYHAEKTISTRIEAKASKKLAVAMKDIWSAHGEGVTLKDLYAVALLNYLDNNS